MIHRDDLPPTPDWSISDWLNTATNEALPMPLLWQGDNA